MLTKLKSSLAILLVLASTSCAVKYKPVEREVPPPPQIRPVEVKADCVCGEALNNVIDNWLDYLAYIEVLKSLGCYKGE